MAEIKNLADKLSTLYEKAKTQEEYEHVIKEEKTASVNLEGKSFDLILPMLLPSFWAEYYLSLKFPSSSVLINKGDFIYRVQDTLSQLKNPDNKVALLYLESVIWSNLLNNQENSNWCNREIETILLNEKVSLASTLRFINSRGLKEMAGKNWQETIGIFDEIEKFPKEALKQPENLRHTANIFSNLGASYIRGNIDIVEGIKNLLIAKEYYLQEKEPPEKHLEGLQNRLGEATEKLKEIGQER